VSYYSTPFGQEYFNQQIPASGSGPEDLVIEKIMLILMVKELKETLSDVEYTAYFERSLNNLSYKQIMDKYGYDYKKVDNALTRVVKKLARLKAVAS
jgi:DNA-binding CsgD family transcriptional regulator